MRLKITPDGTGELTWSLVRSREAPERVADGLRSYSDVDSCCAAAAQMLAARADAMLAVQQPNGSWRWSVRGEDGLPLAQSSMAFETAAACGYALHDLRTEWFTLH